MKTDIPTRTYNAINKLLFVLNFKLCLFPGNPLICDCFLRPLRRYFSEQLNLQLIYKTIRCASPPYLSNMTLYNLPDNRLNCPRNVNTTKIIETQSGEYEVTPDLKFREVDL